MLPLGEETQFIRNMNVTQDDLRRFHYCVPYLRGVYFTCLQIYFVSIFSLMITALLKPLRVPTMVSQMLAGLLLSPTFLGGLELLPNFLATSDFIMLDTYAAFGMIFQLFLAGVQTNPLVIVQGGRKALVIAISSFLVPLSLGISCGLVIATMILAEHDKAGHSIAFIGAIESFTALPVIACYITDLKIQNSEFSRLAIAASMHNGIVLAVVATIIYVVSTGEIFHGNYMEPILALSSFSLLMVGMVYVVRPTIKWMIKQVPEGQRLKQDYLRLMILAVLVVASATDFLGIFLMCGPFLFGMIIPSGPPVGSFLVETFELFNTWLIMPMFYVSHAREIHITMDGESLRGMLAVSVIVLITCIGKFLGAFLPALYYNMSFKEATLLGLTMNTQGFIEILMFKMLKNFGIIDHDAFEVMYVAMIVVTGTLTNLIVYIYKLTKNYKPDNIKTIENVQLNSEFRILACVYEQDNVPSIIHLLKATNPTRHSPVNVSVVHFVELVGHATPLVISHKVQRTMSMDTASSASQRIINVFKKFEQSNKYGVFVHPYTVVSPYKTLHDDLCTLALQKETSLVILPFHKNFATGDINTNINSVNSKLLVKLPCSVGILIDRGLLGGTKFVLANWTAYHVVVIFLGGADDREALALGARMSTHPTIELTVIHFIVIPDEEDEQATATAVRDLDNEALNEFKLRTADNDGVTYIAEEVKTGFEVTQVVESIKDRCELIVLGRRHDRNSKLIIELTEWEKCSELGTVADIFTESGYGGQATLLVMQQKTNVLEDSQDYDC